MHSPPSFLLLKEKDHQEAKKNPYVASMVEWMEAEESEGKEAALHLLRSNKAEEARFTLAKADGFSEILDRINSKDPPEADEGEPEFVHPNMPKERK